MAPKGHKNKKQSYIEHFFRRCRTCGFLPFFSVALEGSDGDAQGLSYFTIALAGCKVGRRLGIPVGFRAQHRRHGVPADAELGGHLNIGETLAGKSPDFGVSVLFEGFL